MNYIVADCEWNYMHRMKGFWPNKKMPNEIIEIGATKINSDTLQIVDTFRTYVKPKLYSRLNPQVTKLSNITKADLEYGVGFLRALELFKKWMGSDVTFCVWGTNDIIEIKRNVSFHDPQVKLDFVEKYVDVQKLFQLCIIPSEKNSISLVGASELLDIFEEGNIHNALIDAKITARILIQLIKNKNIKDIKQYVEDASQLTRIKKVDVKRHFNEINKRKLNITCPICGKFARKTSGIKIKKNVCTIFGKCDKCGIQIKHKTKIVYDKNRNFVYKTTNKIYEKSE
ncbi:3'-5' exonuclease [Anaeromicrobium sediminis]|uniref:Exonuclease domain-containing protein n=1 Tax=Anaeromicrobium sediminis TaxID=1478221 RepID=A0A267MNM2_9FIRM|nr:3'-5' exonuclease [Anaeromicrobium sediminis]PAB61017.1 hypothetical protein CCE28_00885 [Anaeromicrobium sediminis]